VSLGPLAAELTCSLQSAHTEEHFDSVIDHVHRRIKRVLWFFAILMNFSDGTCNRTVEQLRHPKRPVAEMKTHPADQKPRQANQPSWRHGQLLERKLLLCTDDNRRPVPLLVLVSPTTIEDLSPLLVHCPPPRPCPLSDATHVSRRRSKTCPPSSSVRLRRQSKTCPLLVHPAGDNQRPVPSSSLLVRSRRQSKTCPLLVHCSSSLPSVRSSSGPGDNRRPVPSRLSLPSVRSSSGPGDNRRPVPSRPGPLVPETARPPGEGEGPSPLLRGKVLRGLRSSG
jgi:hypothetical protein